MDKQFAIMPYEDYKDICNAVREKTGKTEPITSASVGGEIRNIKSEANMTSLIDGTITEAFDDNATNVKTYFFYNCKSLTIVDLPKVTSVETYAFGSCSALTTINLPMITKFGNYALSSCSSLSTVSFPSAMSFGEYVFNNCSALATADLPSATNIGNATFWQCTKLTTVNIPNAASIGSSAFRYCSALKTVDLPKATSLGSYVFGNCSSLNAVILRAETLCTNGGSNTFTNTKIAKGEGYIYVPRALIEDYKVATNWVTLADQFRALEDYTVDGTTTGEMDWNKINGGVS